MPLPSAIKLFIDPKLGLAFGNFAGSSQITNPTFTLGDTAGIEIYLVENTQVATYPRQELVFPASPGIKVAIGAIDESPTAGTWVLAYGGNTTSALAFNVTAALVQTALNDLASITAAGGVTVSKIGDNYNIAFNTAGVRTELTTDGSSLIPLSTAAVATLQAGTVSKPQISLVHLQRTVAGLATTFTQTTASQITVASLAAWDGSKASFRVSISPDPKGGTFTLSFDAQTGDDVSTASINVGASALDVENALNINSLADKVTVTQVGAYAYDINVAVQPGTLGLTANDAGLLSFSGFKGDLSLNTAEAISLLDGAESVATTLEVEITSDSKTLTLLQIPCVLKNAVIDVGAIDPLVLDTYLSQTTADGRYLRQSNNLSDVGSASTARTNLAVYSTSQVDTALALKADDTDLALKADLFEPVFSGKIQTPTIKNILNADLVIDSYNDTGAGTHYLHKFTPFDGKFVLATNGGGLTFGDGTTQTTAFTGVAATTWGSITGTLASQTDLANSLADKANLAGAAFTGNVTSTGRMAIGGGLANNAANKLAIYDGNIVFSTGFGLAFGDGTTQTTAASTPDLSGYALKSGTTFTGKVNTTTTATTAPINLAGQATAPSTTVAGDLWIGANINYRSWDGVAKAVANTNTTNQFSQGQAITVNSSSNAFRINQQGSGSALVVEDSVTPDGDALIVDANGNLGLGVSNNPGSIWTGSTYKLEVNGAASVSGNLQVGNGATVSGTLRVTYLLDVGTSNDLGMTVAGGIQFGDYTYNSSASMTLGGQRVESNPNTGNLHSSDYPNEIVFKLNGSFYAVPCRVIT